jgi:hypothetical protein
VHLAPEPLAQVTATAAAAAAAAACRQLLLHRMEDGGAGLQQAAVHVKRQVGLRLRGAGALLPPRRLRIRLRAAALTAASLPAITAPPPSCRLCRVGCHGDTASATTTRILAGCAAICALTRAQVHVMHMRSHFHILIVCSKQQGNVSSRRATHHDGHVSCRP